MASAACPAPHPFKPVHGDLETTLHRFEIFYEGIKTYIMFNRRLNAQGNPVNYSEKEKLQLALMIGGEEIRDLLVYTGKADITADDASFSAIFDATLELLKGGINETAAVHALLNTTQDGEPITQYYQRVLKAAKKIDWAAYTAEKAARDVIIRGCDSDKLRLKALQEQVRRLPMATSNAEYIPVSIPTAGPSQQQKSYKRSGGKKCVYCTFVHRPSQTKCPAEGKVCNNCKQTGHFKMSTLCNKREQVRYLSAEEEDDNQHMRSHRNEVRRIKETPATQQESDQSTATGIEEFALESGSAESDESQGNTLDDENNVRRVGSRSPNCSIIFNDKVQIKLFPDTGGRKTLLNKKDWNQIKHITTPLITTKTFHAYGTSAQLPILARAKVKLKAEYGKEHVTYVYIVDSSEVESLLGREDATALGIIKIKPQGEQQQLIGVNRLKLAERSTPASEQPVPPQVQDILLQHEDMFHGLGKSKNQVVDIPLVEDAKAHIQAPRPVAFHYQDKLRKYLDEQISNDVLEGPIQGSLEEGTYISNIVITAKKWSTEEIRMNLDLRQVNRDIVQSYHPISTPEDLRHEFRDSDTFSSLDANQVGDSPQQKKDLYIPYSMGSLQV